MNRKYRKELQELQDKPDVEIDCIYIIPAKAYSGFWGKNGYKSFDFIFENRTGKIGWMHWEGDAIHLENSLMYNLNIDCAVGDDYIRLFSRTGLEISDMIVSDITIKTKKSEMIDYENKM